MLCSRLTPSLSRRPQHTTPILKNSITIVELLNCFSSIVTPDITIFLPKDRLWYTTNTFAPFWNIYFFVLLLSMNPFVSKSRTSLTVGLTESYKKLQTSSRSLLLNIIRMTQRFCILTACTRRIKSGDCQLQMWEGVGSLLLAL